MAKCGNEGRVAERRYVTVPKWNSGSRSPAGFCLEAILLEPLLHSLPVTPYLITRIWARSLLSPLCASSRPAMSSRHHRTRKDGYGYWPTNDSDSDRPRQTMATTQRHNVDQPGGAEAPRKHRSSRRADAVEPLDSSAAYSRHKSSSKDRSSSAQYYAVPPSPNPSVQYQSQNTAYDLRGYIKKKSDKRSPQSSNEKVSADEAKPSRSGHQSKHAYPAAAAYAQPVAPSQAYAVPYHQTIRDHTTSSKPRDREKDREKSSRRDPEGSRTREAPTETSEERRRRKEREREKERERAEGRDRSSKDRSERHRERHRDRDARPAADARPLDASSAYQAPYTQVPSSAQKSADRVVAYPVGLSDIIDSKSLPRAHAVAFMIRAGLCSPALRATTGHVARRSGHICRYCLDRTHFRRTGGRGHSAGVDLSLCVRQGRSPTSYPSAGPSAREDIFATPSVTSE